MTTGSPLAGKRIVITRVRAQAAALADKLAGRGAEPIIFPTIHIAPVDDYGPLDNALQQRDQYQWIVFTSANAVAIFWERLGGRLPSTVRLAAVGPATARALEKRRRTAAAIPDEYVAEALAAGPGDVAGQHILLPHAELAREVLADELRRRGAIVQEVAVYRTLPAAPDPTGLAELRCGVDAITFTSASTVRNFVALLSGRTKYIDAANYRRMGHDGIPMPSLNRAIIACIGPITARNAREVGLPVDVMARREAYTMDGLVAALAEYFSHPELQLQENRWIPARSL